MASSEFIKKAHQEVEMTGAQAIELHKCALDPVYFIKNYCYIQNQKLGKMKFELRPYQETIIRSFHKNRFNILMISRQAGKCLLGSTLINIRKKFNNKLSDVHTIRIDELGDVTACEIDDLNGNLKFIGKKILDDVFVETPTGYSKAINLLKTIEYQIYTLILEDGNKLECADDHIVIDSHNLERFVKDLQIGESIKTSNGSSPVKSIIKQDRFEEMYDLELDDDNHVFYTNNILSHNTETTAAYAYWFSIFNSDKNVLVASNKQKSSTDIMNRIKFMYENTPNWLRPGVTSYNRGSCEFDNGSKIWSEATTESTGRGKSCVSSEARITVRDKDTGEIKQLTMKELKEILSE